MFDEKTLSELKYYVYMLVDPTTQNPFYVGKGKGNRVFSHIEEVKQGKSGTDKLEAIQAILKENKEVAHVIVRHGLNERTAFQIEATLIDVFKFIPNFSAFVKGNVQGGVNSIEKGLMSVDEVKRKYNATLLNSIPSNFVIININGSYKKASGEDRVYKATKQTWRMANPLNGALTYVLSEYKGLIVEVFHVHRWYAINRTYNPGSNKAGKTYVGYGFDGVVADAALRDLYINKSIAHKKKRGASNPITYNL